MTSVWDAGLPPATQELPRGPLDLLVVGGGLSGLSAAYHALARRPGLRVAVLEAARVGAGASGRNTGMVGPGVAQSLASLVRRVGPGAARALYLASLDAVRATRRLVERERIDCDFEPTGQLVVARTRADRARLRRDAALRDRLGLSPETLDDRGLRARIRLEAAGSDADGPAALHHPTAALVDPAKLVAGLARGVRARGAVVCEGARVLRVDGRGPVSVDVAHGSGAVTLRAERAVVAAGSQMPALGLLRGRVLPLRVDVLATAPLPPEAMHFLGWRGHEAVIGASRLFEYFRLTADGRLVFGGGAPRYGAEGEPSFGGLERLMRERFAGVPGMGAVPVTHTWTGTIDYTLDGLPAIGPLRGRPGVVQVAGWCGHGLALSIAAGEWIADRLEDGAAEPLPWFRDLAPLVPLEPVRRLVCRAAIGTMALCDRLERGEARRDDQDHGDSPDLAARARRTNVR